MNPALYVLIAVAALAAIGSLVALGVTVWQGMSEDNGATILVALVVLVSSAGALAGIAYHDDAKTCIVRPSSVVEVGP